MEEYNSCLLPRVSYSEDKKCQHPSRRLESKSPPLEEYRTFSPPDHLGPSESSANISSYFQAEDRQINIDYNYKARGFNELPLFITSLSMDSEPDSSVSSPSLDSSTQSLRTKAATVCSTFPTLCRMHVMLTTCTSGVGAFVGGALGAVIGWQNALGVESAKEGAAQGALWGITLAGSFSCCIVPIVYVLCWRR